MEHLDFRDSVRETSEKNITLVRFCPVLGARWVIYPNGVVEQWEAEPFGEETRQAQANYEARQARLREEVARLWEEFWEMQKHRGKHG